MRAGGVPILLPPLGFGAREVATMLAALIVTGGTDVCPSRYGAVRHPATQVSGPDRDAWESELIQTALVRDVPVLGICRGMQLLNVVCGGTLVQHLPDVVGHDEHAPGPGRLGTHLVSVEPTSLLSGVVGGGFGVATYHHQAVDRTGVGVQAVGWADDGTIEAVEMPGQWFAVGIQGHPEAGEDLRIFRALVDAARGSEPRPRRSRVPA